MKRILIVEDNASIAELERDYLEANDFAVDIAADGTKGLAMAESGDYDLLLLDVMLPGIDGWEICRRLRKTSEMPILMVSARKDDIDKIRGLGLGADDYISKPFSPAELTARVKAHLARYERLMKVSQKQQSEDIEVGDLRIEPEARRVYKAGKEVSLTNREFELLYFLAKHPGIVFSKEKIFEAVWGFDALSDTATVTVHVNRLRDKIEDDPQKPRYIETVWGAGYRFGKS